MPYDQLRAAFFSKFGQWPTIFAQAPGRVNLIGEHTDYNEGFVFPAAISRRLVLAAARSEGPSAVFSLQAGQGETFDVDSLFPHKVAGWAAYPAGVAWALGIETHERLPNLNALISSDIPIASGISSSAALELSFACAWNLISNLGLNGPSLAQVGQKSENDFVGVQCGIMDQMAIAMGKANCAMFLDTRSLDIQYAPIPLNVCIVICDTGKPRQLTNSAYNERRRQCEEAARILGVKALRDATVELLLTKQNNMSDIVYKRAMHVITENQRCVLCVKALESEDLVAVGRLMADSHASLRDDYAVSSPELDAMAEAAWQAPGVIGARMTGAGFGGACVALVQRKYSTAFIEQCDDVYRRKVDCVPSFIECEAVGGASAHPA